MPSLTLATARDLTRWAAYRTAQEELPALVRRLIHATTTTATRVGIPAGDAVQIGGYDGVVVIAEDHAFVPNGASVWEMGVTAQVATKANGDYEKRTREQPVSDWGPVVPAETTFVFVTPRRWPGKVEWAEARRREGVWRDVRVLDADDLEAWLEQAPATHVWFSGRVGARPPGADDLGEVWQDWAQSTNPPLSPALMFAGREESRDAITGWLRGGQGDGGTTPSPTLGVESESPEETVALIAAAIQSLGPEERIAVLARTVLARDADALTQLAGSGEPVVIVCGFAPGDLALRAVRGGHRVLIPRVRGEGVTGTLTLPRPHREAASNALEAMGLAHDRARDLGGLARRSVLALRRRLATSAAVGQPAWASPEVGPGLLPILLLGGLNDQVEGDREVLSALAGESADAVLARFMSLVAAADPPVLRRGGVWYLVSKADAWEALSRYLGRDLLERFETVAVGALGTPDPSYELPPDQRWAAGLYQEKRAHSGLLTRAIADTLALLGARGGVLSLGGGLTAADVAARAVRRLFEQAGRDWTRWASLAPVMPLLAEAAPDEFLNALEGGLAGDSPSPVMGLFGHDVAHTFSSSPHTHLLWALERVAWSPALLGRGALVLAELARRDPGGSLQNRPRMSLRSIFLPWMPATAAPMETRLEVIDLLREREPAAAWNLMADLLPRWHDSNMRAGRPDWREWAPEGDTRTTRLVLERHAEEMTHRLIADAGTEAPRWRALVEAIDDVPLAAHEALLEALARAADRGLPRATRTAVWNALRELLHRHRSVGKADWRMPDDRLDAIEEVFRRFEPEDLVERYAWLFSNRPALPDGRGDYRDHGRRVEEQRVEAMRAWYPVLCTQGVISLAAQVDRPDALGQALAGTRLLQRGAEEASFVRSALASDVRAARVAGRAYLVSASRLRGPDTIPTLLAAEGAAWPHTVQAEALLALPTGQSTWALVEALDEAGQTHYWGEVPPFWVEGPDVERAMRELVRHGRPHAALDLAAAYADKPDAPPATVVRDTLLAAARLAPDANGERASGYEITMLFELLERAVVAGEIGEEEVAQLELLYLPAISDERSPRLLHAAMGREPTLFVEAACLAFRGEGEAARDLSPEEQGRAQLAYELLHGWRTPPGLAEGVIDGAQLTAWVTAARGRLAEANRVAIGDVLIGELLSGSPPGADGAWPAEPVRDLIEQTRSDELLNGLRAGRFNQRGVVSKHPLTGGALERAIVERYEADAATLAARWPRTAAFLRSFAQSYAHDAEREDLDAELRHDLDW